MGCGSSKSSQVNETAITIKPNPGDPSDSQGLVNSTDLQNQNTEIRSSEGSNAEIVKLIQEPISDFSSHLDDTKQRPILPSLVNECSITEDNQSYPKPIAFNVPFEEDKDTMEIKGRPKRLKKLESLPKLVTAESLAEKQKAVEERKKQVLSKRKESRRASKIRDEIFSVRESQRAQEIFEEVEREISANQFNKDNTRCRTKGENSNENESVSEEMEVDNTFNADHNYEELCGNSENNSDD